MGCGVWRMAARALLILFALRAAILVGFMPDFEALRDGRVEIVVCTPEGLKTIAVDRESGRPAQDGDRADHSTLNDCPFQTVIAKAFAIPAVIGLPSVGIGRSEDIPRRASPVLLPPAQGPPLGPRAPPAILA